VPNATLAVPSPAAATRSPVDWICIAWYALLFLLCLVNVHLLPDAWQPLSFFGGACVLFIALPIGTSRLTRGPGLAARVVILCLVIPATFDMVGRIVPWISPDPRESWLLRADSLIFGSDPTRWTGSAEHFPWLTELLQVVYTSFYFLGPVLALRLLWKRDTDAIEHTLLVVAAGFLISYLGYLLVPGRSPYQLYQYPFEFRGVFVTEGLRKTIHMLEGARFDAFPSGHCDVTWLLAACAYRHDRKSYYLFFLPIAVALPVSTVYLRYHFGIDVIAGALWAAATWIVCERVWRASYPATGNHPA
jgi:membrane-associated phospholipid phosphatase